MEDIEIYEILNVAWKVLENLENVRNAYDRVIMKIYGRDEWFIFWINVAS